MKPIKPFQPLVTDPFSEWKRAAAARRSTPAMPRLPRPFAPGVPSLTTADAAPRTPPPIAYEAPAPAAVVPPSTPAVVLPPAAGAQDYNGKVYRPKPGPRVRQQSAYRPIVFPGIAEADGTRAKYQDGSVVDYASLAWQKASAYRPPAGLEDLWGALPDSWKAELAGWDASYVQAYLHAVSRGAQGGLFRGEYMSGIEAAQEIKNMARQAAARAAQGRQPQPPPFEPGAGRPSPYLVK